MRKNFIHKNESFTCEHCGAKSPLLKGSCRNHCHVCLWSKHVDLDLPGDRSNKCEGMMEPVALEYNSKKGYIIIHRCQQCGEEKRNKLAEDDNQEVVLMLAQEQF